MNIIPPDKPDKPGKKNKTVNISSYLCETAKMQPNKKAVVFPVSKNKTGRTVYSHITFIQLEKESDRIALGLEKLGITRGTRTVLMVKPGPNFFALIFALFKIGAIPVVVDPGMGISRMIRCFKSSRPKAFIGIPIAHVVRILYPKFFRTVKIWVTVGRRWFWGGPTLKRICKAPWKPYLRAKTRHDDIAAILFTTGSTGPAKGVIYTHGIFNAQVRHIKSHFKISANEIDLPTFPLFALFDPALGMTAVIPDMDPTKPGFVDPEKIIEPITRHGVTNMFASPALLNRVGNYCKQKKIRLPSIKRVISAGAPVSPANIKQFASILSKNAEIHTPYGATEAMPLISIKSSEILGETGKFTDKGYGICLGLPIDGIQVRIIKISDAPVKEWSDSIILPDGEVGEIVAKGDIVTRQYFEDSKSDALAKIKQGDCIWHRMGDLGWLDNKKRIWFCGRKSHRVRTKNGDLFTIPFESIFNNHPAVFRSALVGVGPLQSQKPVICIELKHGSHGKNKKKMKNELLELAKQNVLTENIDTILFCKSFPVDIRHNAKIFREELAAWAKKKVR